MSRPKHIGRCAECGKEYRYGDCFTRFCFDHDPQHAWDRALAATPRQRGESRLEHLRRVNEAELKDPYRRERKLV